MTIVINEAIIPMVNDGLISVRRIHDLIRIKEFIDSVVSKEYLEKRSVEDIRDRVGVLPNIITWGDYFQTEMASLLLNMDDDEFARAVETVIYDVISSNIIFSDKGQEFFEWVDYKYYEVIIRKNDNYSPEEVEILHLKILKDYFVDMGIMNNFSEVLMDWYYSFKEAEAM